jgi:hypothetical protein
MLWSSVCYAHKGKNIKMGKKFLSNLSEINTFKEYKKERPFIFSDIVLRSIGGKITQYIAPSSESPSSIRDSKMLYTLGEMGAFYTLSISQDRKISIVSEDKDYNPTYSVECNKELLAYKIDLPKEFPLATKAYCRSIWNETTKKYETIMIHSFCP